MLKLNRPKKLRFPLLIVICLITFSLAIYSDLSKPDSAQVKSTEKAAANTTQLSYNINLTPVTQADSYLSFNYPEGMALKSSTPSGNSLADFYYTARDIQSWTLAIDVATAPNGQANATSGFLYRQENPSEYKEATENVNGSTIYIFSDTDSSDSFAKAAFFSHGNLVASVALSGSDVDGNGPLNTTFNMVLSSWLWL